MSNTFAGFCGTILGWWALDRFFGGQLFAWMPTAPAFPKDGTSYALLLCTTYLLVGLDEVRGAISKRGQGMLGDQ